jgi:hypothetical protein
LLKTLNEIGEVTVRSSPRITTPNGQEAEIIVGEIPHDLRIGMLATQTADNGVDLSFRLHMSRSSRITFPSAKFTATIRFSLCARLTFVPHTKMAKSTC